MEFEVTPDLLDRVADDLDDQPAAEPVSVPAFGGPATVPTISVDAANALADWSDYLYECEQSFHEAARRLRACAKAYRDADQQVEEAVKQASKALR